MASPLEPRWLLVAFATSVASCATYGPDLLSAPLEGDAGGAGRAGNGGSSGGGAGGEGVAGSGGAMAGTSGSVSEGGTSELPNKPYLSASIDAAPVKLDLSAEGTLDWAHWGLPDAAGYNHKTGVTSQLLDFKPTGASSPASFSEGRTLFTWNDGEPTAMGSTIDGIVWSGLDEGFELVVPAVVEPRRLQVFVGVFAGTGRFKAALSDPRATTKVDTPLVSAKEEWVLQVVGLEYGGADVKGTKLDVTFSVEAMVAPSAAVSIAAMAIAPR